VVVFVVDVVAELVEVLFLVVVTFVVLVVEV